MPTSRLQFQDYQFDVVLPVGPWKWTTRVDVSGALPTFSVRDVISPYGLLRDSIPIPGVVIQAMADSITKLQQSFAPSILLAPTSLSFVVDEGRGVSAAQLVTITNDGVFGSLLGVSITSSAAYLAATPANINGLASTEAGQFSVTADSTQLLAIASPYAGTLTVQDADATNNPQTIPVTITVRPKATIALAPIALAFTVAKPLVPPFPAIPTQTFTITNTGPSASVLQYQIQKLTNCSPWLVSFVPAFGSINGGLSQLVTVAVQPGDAMQPGTYTETLRVSGYSSNFFQDIIVTLTIT